MSPLRLRPDERAQIPPNACHFSLSLGSGPPLGEGPPPPQAFATLSMRLPSEGRRAQFNLV